MPDETTGLPVIVFIHGGGYRFGSANQYTVQKLIYAIPLKNNAIVNKLYRLTPLQLNESFLFLFNIALVRLVFWAMARPSSRVMQLYLIWPLPFDG